MMTTLIPIAWTAFMHPLNARSMKKMLLKRSLRLSSYRPSRRARQEMRDEQNHKDISWRWCLR